VAAVVSDEWTPTPAPTWVAFVPSGRHPELVADLAARVGAALGLPVVTAVEQIRETDPQTTMENSARQRANVVGAFAIRGPLPAGPALLIDTVVDSRWTLTEIGGQLRAEGCPAVYPLTLADAGAS